MRIDRASDPDQPQRLHIGGQCIADAGIDRVEAFAGLLDHHVANIVDDIAVVAKSTGHTVSTGAAIQQIAVTRPLQIIITAFAIEADHRPRRWRNIDPHSIEPVIAVITMRIDRALDPDQPQRFHILRQRIADAGIDRVKAFAGLLDHNVASMIDDIAIIADPTSHDIRARRALDKLIGISECLAADDGVGTVRSVCPKSKERAVCQRRQVRTDLIQPRLGLQEETLRLGLTRRTEHLSKNVNIVRTGAIIPGDRESPVR